MSNIGPKTYLPQGMIFYYDPANPRSFPRPSSTWYDLIRRGSCALTDFEYVSGYNGVFSLNGLTSKATLNSITLFYQLNEFTISVWFLIDENFENEGEILYSIDGVTGNGVSILIDSSFNIKCTVNPGVQPDNGGSITTGRPLQRNRWYFMTFLYNGSADPSSWGLYLDAEPASFLSDGSLLGAGIGKNTTYFGGGVGYFKGKLGLIKAYEGNPTESQILLEYDSTRSRYII